MTQSTDITLGNQSGANYRTEHNSINQAFGTNHKGSSAPSYAVTGMHWIDDSSTPWIEKIYDSSDWIALFEIDPTANTITVINHADGDARTEVANIGQIQDSVFVWLGTSTGANTITAGVTPAITAYSTGQVFRFIAGGTSTGAVTLNIDSVGVKDIQFQGTAIGANSIISGQLLTVVYDGTQFQLVSPIGGTEGDLLYYNASNVLTRLPKGIDDQVLTLASGLPSWADAGGGGGAWVALETQTALSDAAIDFTSFIDGTYKSYAMLVSSIKPDTLSQVVFSCLLSSDGGVTFLSSGYSHCFNGIDANGTVQNGSSTSIARMEFGNSVAGDTGELGAFLIYFDNPASADTTVFDFSSAVLNASSILTKSSGAAIHTTATTIDGLRFFFDGANIASGTFTLYGISGA